jgi:dynein light chain LC8-type
MSDSKVNFLKKTDTASYADQEFEKKVEEIAREAVENSKNDTDIARAIKEKCDMEFGECWHCIVGEKFATWVTHEQEKLLYFLLGKHAILVFKTS